MLTVIPLTSLKVDESQIHPDDVFLGNEIYKSLKLKYNIISQNLNKEKAETEEYHKAFNILYDMAKEKLDVVHSSPSDSSTFEQDMQEAQKHVDTLRKIFETIDKKVKDNTLAQQQLEKIGAEIAHMKVGSVALVSSITTISKMRIYDPKNARGVLNGIRLSENAMEKINLKLKELFIHA